MARPPAAGYKRPARGQRRALKGRTKPRVYTPPLRRLTPETSLGYDAINFAQGICGLSLYPWQKWLLIHALELDPRLTVSTMHLRGRLDPLFRFKKVVVLVARQNGKSRLSQVLALWAMYRLQIRMVLGTAQDLDTAEEIWEGAQDLIDETPELAAMAIKPVRNNGKKAIRLTTGERYKVKAANRRAGRGLTGDLIMLDELREHQTWEAWAAITKTTMARPAAQIWAMSNAGDMTSVVLRYLRKAAHAELGDPDGINDREDPNDLLPSVDSDDDDFDPMEPDDSMPEVAIEEDDASTLGIFEWSAPPGCAPDDTDGWEHANPSLGFGISERDLRDSSKEPESIFRTECLCQWIDGTLAGTFPPGSWEALAEAESKAAPDGQRVLCITTSWNRSRTHVSLAGYRADGSIHVGLVASRAGTHWVRDWLRANKGRADFAVMQAKGAPESTLFKDLAADEDGMEIKEWNGSDLPQSHGDFYDAIAKGEDGIVFHRPQPLLDKAVASAQKKALGGMWVVDVEKSKVDASPLKGVIGAYWGLTRSPDVPVSAYENGQGVTLV